MVTPDAPVKAVKKAHDTMPAMASPPGIQPSRALKSLSRRCGPPPAAMVIPAKVNKGMVIKLGWLARRYSSIIRPTGLISEAMLAYRPPAPRTINRGSPTSASKTSIEISMAISCHRVDREWVDGGQVVQRTG